MKHPIAQKRSYSCDMTLTYQADRETSHLIAQFLPVCDENQNYSQYRLVYIPNRNCFIFFHIQGLHIFASGLSDFRGSARLA
jgi:hypothetical protein